MKITTKHIFTLVLLNLAHPAAAKVFAMPGCLHINETEFSNRGNEIELKLLSKKISSSFNIKSTCEKCANKYVYNSGGDTKHRISIDLTAILHDYYANEDGLISYEKIVFQSGAQVRSFKYNYNKISGLGTYEEDVLTDSNQIDSKATLAMFNRCLENRYGN